MDTLQEFAERVLFSPSLEEKLAAPPAGLRDDPSVPALVTPPEPGREAGLRLVTGDRADFPREHELKDERARGRLLHFLANHELLATELMALAILKFPDAPEAFRRGLLHTLHEEQLHTRWYLARMREYGVTFGEQPVNGFFWSAVAGMETPLDYVSRLPLTFEQANLDYSLYYSEIFGREGDERTRKLLQTIHDDEIGHVAYGLNWFRKWKDPAETDWQALEKKLVFPLSPVRAKGREPLDFDGRRKAGLTDEYIRSLELFSRSRGRTPYVYFFNPSAEHHAAGLPVDGPAQALEEDLELAMLALAREEDVLLVRRAPRPEHLRRLRGAGIPLPEIESLVGGAVAAGSLLRERKISGLRPWAWGPESAEVFSPLAAETGWAEACRGLYSKEWGAEVLRQLDDPLAGVAARSVDEAAAAVAGWREKGHARVLVKAAFGLAGRGQLRVDEWTPAVAAQAGRLIEAHGCVVVEPLLERVFDFSVQTEVERGPDGVRVRMKGPVQLVTDGRGQFVACEASPRFSSLFTPEVARFFQGTGRTPWWKALYEERVFPLIEARLAGTPFRGPLGIDAFVWRQADGALALRSVVEINPRATMGRVTLEALRWVALGGKSVRFQIMPLGAVKKLGCADFLEYEQRLAKEEPLEIVVEGRERKIARGALVLNDAAVARGFVGVVRVR